MKIKELIKVLVDVDNEYGEKIKSITIYKKDLLKICFYDDRKIIYKEGCGFEHITSDGYQVSRESFNKIIGGKE